MRRFLIACALAGALTGLLVGLLAPPRADPVYQSQTIACTRAAIYDASSSGSTKLVTGNATQQIYVCGFAFFAGGTTTGMKLVYGTGGTCGAGTTSITPGFPLVAQSQLVDHQTFYAGLAPVPVSNDLCINVGAGVAAQAIVYYAQF